MEALSGELLAKAPDAIWMDGVAIVARPHRATRAGLCAVPEERNGHAAVGDFTLSENGSLTARRRMGFMQGA